MKRIKVKSLVDFRCASGVMHFAPGASYDVDDSVADNVWLAQYIADKADLEAPSTTPTKEVKRARRKRVQKPLPGVQV